MAINNGWMDEIENENSISNNNSSLNETQNNVQNTPKTDFEMITDKQFEFAKRYKALKNLLESGNDEPRIKHQISECERLIVELEDLKRDLEKLGPNATIEQVKKMKEEEKSVSSGIGPIKKLSNPAIPNSEAINGTEVKVVSKPDSFFKTFIYTAAACSVLMSGYMFLLF